MRIRIKHKQAHISIDDVQYALCLMDSSKYMSVWQIPLFRLLKQMHIIFGASFTLYIYYECDEWSLEDTTSRFHAELSRASSWLKFGLHSRNSYKPVEVDPEYGKLCCRVNFLIQRFAGSESVASINRQHYWFYPKDHIKALKDNGVNTILVDDKSLFTGTSTKMIFWKTSIRIEHKISIIKALHESSVNNQPCVIFTHEWALNKKNKFKLIYVVALLSIFGYKFNCY